MGVTVQKYGVSVCFFRELVIFVKTIPPMDFGQKFENFESL
jgi:hypothetical protein